ncbi:exodeoxyribonuclease VII large subunit [Clostridiaceae bacterium 35-E11]
MRIKTLSVSDLNKYIKKLLIADPILNNITLKGEISNLKMHSSGHLYFSMKDENSKINCVMFNENCKYLRFNVADGMKVCSKGYVSTFEKNGQYQMYIEEMEPDGIGTLYLAFEQLKMKLEKEGLFDHTRKKTIPYFPKKIAVVTSPTGAAIRDIVSIIKRRNNYVDIIVYPVVVQGENASVEIAQAIKQINENSKDVDLIITGRGGGSIEELWAFNEEIVARSIACSKIPIISAVGHETDYTISDFVADLRAPTPSAAAELAVPHIGDIKNRLDSLYHRANTLLIYQLKEKRNQLALLNESKMLSCIDAIFDEERQVVDLLQNRLLGSVDVTLETYRIRVINSISRLETLNPLATILRGYAVVLDQDKNKMVKTVEDVEIEDNINIMLTNGILSCLVTERKKEDNVFGYFNEYKSRTK